METLAHISTVRRPDKPWRHLYNSKAWHRLRTKQLMAEPLCAYCQALGRVTAAQVVDHKTPHKGDAELFHDPDNLQSLCKTCHDSAKQRQEKSGHLVGCDASGIPVDPGHHWS